MLEVIDVLRRKWIYWIAGVARLDDRQCVREEVRPSLDVFSMVCLDAAFENECEITSRLEGVKDELRSPG